MQRGERRAIERARGGGGGARRVRVHGREAPVALLTRAFKRCRARAREDLPTLDAPTTRTDAFLGKLDLLEESSTKAMSSGSVSIARLRQETPQGHGRAPAGRGQPKACRRTRTAAARIWRGWTTWWHGWTAR